MKILLFEYVCGGGFCQQDLPPLLVREGKIMLQALLQDLLLLPAVQLIVPLDYRLIDVYGLAHVEQVQYIEIKKVLDINAQFADLISLCDAVWPIAPESGGVLTDICKQVIEQDKLLLSSSVAATQLCSHKYDTYRCLKKHAIVTPKTELLSALAEFQAGSWIIKPLHGVGCEGVCYIDNKTDYQALIQQIDVNGYILQPYQPGANLSVSCLFKHGRAWLLCCNEQSILRTGLGFALNACQVNIPVQQKAVLQQIIADIAIAIPELWGYVGIDLIVSAKEVLVLEINPRLTTSYAGIKQATGLNVAELVLQLMYQDPEIQHTNNATVRIQIE